ncbi:hypothetical protein PG997_001534 [Apiospora hydei]|uniref:Protein kinase domain-containing protein n=1 Tax=Apiospora hydei TaxID=1337664 RepID=A0ABR1XE33_9PEZI
MLLYDEACIPEPRLHPFDTGGEPLVLDFIESLGSGVHAHVWKVRINGELYALKMFTNQQDIPPLPLRLRDEYLDEADEWPHFHAFPNECRAFARLKEFGQEHLAVPCYGWIEADESHYEFMDTQIDETGWSGEDDVGRKRYAIVKELLDMQTDTSCVHIRYLKSMVDTRVAKRAFKGLKTMHDLGILVGDIKEDSMCEGKHVDLSRARAAPHPALPKDFADNPFEWHVNGGAFQDARDFEELVLRKHGWNYAFPANKLWDRIFPNPDYIGKLRSSDGLSPDQVRRKCLGNGWPGHPELFSYEKAKKRFRYVPASGRKPRRPGRSRSSRHSKLPDRCELCEGT